MLNSSLWNLIKFLIPLSAKKWDSHHFLQKSSFVINTTILVKVVPFLDFSTLIPKDQATNEIIMGIYLKLLISQESCSEYKDSGQQGAPNTGTRKESQQNLKQMLLPHYLTIVCSQVKLVC